MTSERIQKRIESLLDEADGAAGRNEWATVRERANAVLAFDPENQDARLYLDAAQRGLSASGQTEAAAVDTAVVVPSSPASPTSFVNGRYEVRRFLGEGGKKKVYLAHDSLLDRDIAFALIKTEGLDEVGKERITREAQAMGRLGDHPNIVTVYDIGTENGQPYLVLPLLPGGDIEGLIEKAPEHRLPIEQVVKLGIETCLGLEFAHGKSIVHRDLKPGNVWLDEAGRAKIGDFGLAVAVDRSRLTQAGMMVGTVNYMPPEQAMGGEVTPRSDLYSLGAMLYEMVCGRPPFVGDESVAIIGQHLNTPPIAPAWHRPDCPPSLEALLLRLLEKDPSSRPGSATEVREVLQLMIDVGRQASDSSDASTAASGAMSDPLYRSVFIGREQELRQLQQAFDAALSGQTGLAMVVGEPGIGKTALCEQLATYVALRGGRTLIGHCYEEGSLSLPYLAFVEAMRSYVLARDPEGLRSDLGSNGPDVARIISEVRDRVQGVELRASGDPEDDRWRLLQAVASFLRNASAVQPLLIVLEDLHWADHGTLDMLLHLARNLPASGAGGVRLLIVGTYRDVEVDRTHPLSSTLADLRRGANFRRVPLRGLTVDEVHRMYEAIRGNDVPWSQAEAVHRATEGNPLFVQEVLRYLVEEGLVVREDGRYVAQQGVGAGIPEGLRDVVGKRLNHLSEAAGQALTVASVIGRDFRLDVLQAVLGVSEDDLFRALEEAEERAIIQSRDLLGAIGFRFTHAFFRQTLYEEIFAPRRIRLHQQVARALEGVYSRRLDEHAAELAEHYSQSVDEADLVKAVEFSRRAGLRATQVFDYGEALRRFEQALKAQEILDAEDRSTLCDIWLQIGSALFELDDRARALTEAAQNAVRLAESVGDSHRSFAACRLALDCLIGPTRPETEEWLARAETHLGTDARDRIRLQRAKAGHLVQAGFDREAVVLLKDALELAREVGDFNEEAGVMWLILGPLDADSDEESRLLTRASELEVAEGISNLNRFNLLNGSAMTRLSRRERSLAESEAARLAQYAHEVRTPQAIGMSNYLQAQIAVFDGDLSPRLHGILRDGIVADSYNYRSDRWLGVQPHFQMAVANRRSLLLSLFAVLRQLDDGEIASAKASFAELMASLASKLDKLGSRQLALLLELADVVSDKATARRLFDALLDLAPARRLVVYSPTTISVDLVLARAAISLGLVAKSREFAETSMRVCEEARLRPEFAISHLFMAELLLDNYPGERDAAIEHLDFAIAEFQAMKMQPSLERALRHRGLLKA